MDGEKARFVVRRHRRVAAEFRLLGALREVSVPAPAPCLVGEDFIVTGFIEGEATTQECDSRRLATSLATLHRTDWTGLDLSFLPRLPSRNDAVLLHGDFWPGNTLWRDGELVALIDWEDAAVGDPLADLANGRLEVLFAFGEDAMDEFADAYRAAMPELDYADLAQWDLYALRRLVAEMPNWGLDPGKEEELRRRAEWFAARIG